MQQTLEVENIKCGGCAHTIKTKLQEKHGIAAEIDVEHGVIRYDSDKDIRTDALETLRGLGYPERGSAEGIEAVKAKAVSFVSCAIGRVTKPD
jgi:copper chaperone